MDKAIKLYDALKRSAATEDSVKHAMGYDLKTSHGMRAISALIQFGLIEVEGMSAGRLLRLSDLCLNVLLRSAADPERLELLREAAVKPTIYRQIVERWGRDLPRDDALANFLLFERNFNPDVVPHVVRDFRATYEYVKLHDWQELGPQPTAPADHAMAAPHRTADEPPHEPPGNATAERTQSDRRVYRLPLPGSKHALLDLPGELSSDDIGFLLRYLELMREALERVGSEYPRLGSNQRPTA
jgi:hypothetical protein